MTQLKFNVAQLLREVIGARRHYEFEEPALPLDDTLVLRDIWGEVQFTRTASGVFARISVQGTVRLVCVRSLEEFDYALYLAPAEEMHSIVDVVSGVPLASPTEEDPFLLDELHMADIGEIIREYALLELPLNPVSEAYRDQPISYTVQSAEDEESDEEAGIDKRLAILKSWKQHPDSQN
jgi:uncharacterized protein